MQPATECPATIGSTTLLTDSLVIPFDTSAHVAKMDPNDLILSIAERLAKYGSGGTDCSLPLAAANQMHAKRKFAGIVLVTDNESPTSKSLFDLPKPSE